MDLFDHTGHLTDTALSVFQAELELEPLDRLEIAEHLSFCDQCLMRSINLLPQEALLVPERSCQTTLWHRIRLRAVRALTSRYATAAAAVTIVFSLWGGGIFTGLAQGATALASYRIPQTERPAVHQIDTLGDALRDRLDSFQELLAFDLFAAPNS